MSDPTASDKPGQLDLTSLRLMPDWVANIGKEAPAQKFRDYEGERDDRGGRRDDRRGSSGGRPGGRDERGGRFGGAAGGGERRRHDGFGGKGKGRGGPRDERRGSGRELEQREPVPTDISVTIEAEEKSADALAAHIKHTGRAFSMFDASRLVLGSGERFHVRFTCAPERPAGLFRVVADGAVFLSRDEASRYILNSGALADYYRTEEVEQEEPKGEFKSVGVCGMSGTLLGPPSHHSYQPTIVRLHREKFANMLLEDFKRRIRVEADPELVAKWKEQQRKSVRWTYLKGQPAEGAVPTAFATRAEMESHFRRTHTEDAIEEVREVVVPGTGAREKLSRVLIILLGRAVEDARNHLFAFSQHLGQALEHRGLKLFKRRSGKLFVSRVRPKAIDPGVIFSDRINAIVETIKERPGITHSKLVEAIAAGSSPPAATESAAPAPEEAATVEASQLTDAQIAVMKDLRWLADEGYVIEYSDGPVFLGVQNEAPAAPKAPKPKQPRFAKKAPAALAGVVASDDAAQPEAHLGDEPTSQEDTAPAAEETAPPPSQPDTSLATDEAAGDATSEPAVTEDVAAEVPAMESGAGD